MTETEIDTRLSAIEAALDHLATEIAAVKTTAGWTNCWAFSVWAVVVGLIGWGLLEGWWG